jgi:hypothetical protein
MSKKPKAAVAENDVDAMLEGNGGEAEAAAPAKKTKKATPATPAVPPKKGGTKKATPAVPATPAKKAKAKAAPAEDKPAADSALRKALLKVKKAVSYGDFAEANDFNIRSVRRTARAMRDAGEIDLVREGQIVYIQAAV